MIILSIYDNPEYVRRSLEIGALGYVSKDAVAIDLLKAVCTVYEGKHYFSQKIVETAICRRKEMIVGLFK